MTQEGKEQPQYDDVDDREDSDDDHSNSLFFFNFQPEENSSFIIWKNEKIQRSAVPQVQNKTVNSMEVYCNHKSGLLFKFWLEMN